jgi:two-component system sensor histidine kinase HydH
MEQVLLNLLLNARQAVGDYGGTVTVETRSAPGEVVVSVVDSGPGIPPERLAQIFKPFYTTRSHGTGLGLAIVKKIVEAHGGRIEVTSPPGGGARFTVHLREGG